MHSPVVGPVKIRGNGWNRTHNILGKGIRIDEKTKLPRDHQGWDIVSTPGSPVFAVTFGVISSTRDDGDKGYGRQVVLEFDHKGKTYYALYGHLLSIEVIKGQFVGEGERLGTSGQTGNAHKQALREAHLHFELRDKLNPGAHLAN